MTGGLATSAVALGLALVAAASPRQASAAAEGATVTAADPGVQVGRPPDWRAAKPGVVVEAGDLLQVPEGAKVTVRLPDGQPLVVEGRTLVSGRRLLTDKSAGGRMVFFAKAFREAAATLVLEVEENGTTALAVRGEVSDPLERTRLGQRTRALAFLGESDDESPKSSMADFAESHLRRGDAQLAVDAAWIAITSPEASHLERRRGHLVMARIAANDGHHLLAMRDLHAACRTASPEPGAAPYLAAALATRGQAWMALGDDDKAIVDFRAALDWDATGAAGAQAAFFLGALALSREEREAARDLFSRLKRFPELARAGEELLSAMNE